MTAAGWTIGGIIILAAGLWPLRTLVKRPRRGALDEARSLLSQLNTAIDLAAGPAPAQSGTVPAHNRTVPAETRAEAERYQLLAGAALAGDPDQDDCRRSIEWSRSGLALLNGS